MYMVPIMKRMTAISIVAILAILSFSRADAQELRSRFLPDRIYNVSITKTLSGNDGERDISPVLSTQRMRIETGALQDGAIPVTLESYSTVQASRGNEEMLQWKFAFNAHEDGSITDVHILSSTEPFPDDLAFSVLSRELSPVLFQTVYKLQERNKDRVVIGRTAEHNGAESFVDLEYTVDKSLSELEEGESREPMATEDSGTAIFNTDSHFFLQRVLNEVNRIYVSADEMGDAKNVIMRRDVRIEVKIEEA